MKKILLATAILCCMAISSSAQSREFSFKRFRVDLGSGYGLPFSDYLNSGVLLYLEPKFELTPNVQAGIRGDFALFAGASETSVGLKVSTGWMLTGDYLFHPYPDKSFRPFLGGGLGLYTVAGGGATASGVDELEASTSNFGIMLRGGIDVRHWRLGLSYNMAFAETMFHYLGLNVGWYIGGGKK